MVFLRCLRPLRVRISRLAILAIEAQFFYNLFSKSNINPSCMVVLPVRFETYINCLILNIDQSILSKMALGWFIWLHFNKGLGTWAPEIFRKDWPSLLWSLCVFDHIQLTFLLIFATLYRIEIGICWNIPDYFWVITIPTEMAKCCFIRLLLTASANPFRM